MPGIGRTDTRITEMKEEGKEEEKGEMKEETKAI